MLHTYNDLGIVLRSTKLGEADKIITLLTCEHGQVRAVAKGLRRTNSKFGARLSVGNCVNLQLHRGRNLETITQAESVGLYGTKFSTDYGRYLCAQVILETAEKLSDEQSSRPEFRLLQGALAALADNRYPSGMILGAYLLRALSLSGWSPQLTKCAVCGKSQQLQRFSFALGGTICADCTLSGGSPISPSTLKLLLALLRGDWQQVRYSSNSDQAQAEEIATTWAQWVLERRLKSLSVLETGT